MTLLNPMALFLLPGAGLFLALMIVLNRRNMKNLAGWAGNQSSTEKTLQRVFRRIRPWLVFASLLCLILALARPVWDPQPLTLQTGGQDTVFLVDVSRSMDTPDVDGKSRLDAVKAALIDLAPELEGDRAALAVFAGTVVVKCPLSSDIGFFRQAVSLLDTRSTSRGGTLMGDALRRVKQDFYKDGKALAVWVFTDGGDQESFPVEAAQDLGQSGITVHIWGVGTLQGGQVPDREVQSGLNETLLKQVAQAVPGGTYAGPEAPLWQISQAYRQYHQALNSRQSSRMVYQEGAWWLLWPAGIFFFLDALSRLSLGARPGRGSSTGSRDTGSQKKKPRPSKVFKPGLGLMIALLAAVLSVSCSQPQQPEWKSPADKELLASLETRTLEEGMNPGDRAKLLFLWGQEMLAQSKAAQDQGQSGDFRTKAIAAFERVVDLGSVLVDESRWNLEILYQDQAQQDQSGSDQNKDQDKQDKQDKKNQDKQPSQNQQGKDGQKQDGQDQKSGQDQQGKDGQKQGGQDQKTGQDQQGKNGPTQEGQKQDGKDGQSAAQAAQKAQDGKDKQQAKDLSGLVRDKPGNSKIQAALEDEKNRQTQAQSQFEASGGITPVDKDW